MQREVIDLLKSLPKRSAWVFYRADGTPYIRDHIYGPFKRILKRLGIDTKKYSWKELRHTIASLMYRKGVPALAIKDQLRHSSIRTTVDFYIGSDPDVGGESFGSGEAGYQDRTASDGVFFCERAWYGFDRARLKRL